MTSGPSGAGIRTRAGYWCPVAARTHGHAWGSSVRRPSRPQGNARRDSDDQQASHPPRVHARALASLSRVGGRWVPGGKSDAQQPRPCRVDRGHSLEWWRRGRGAGWLNRPRTEIERPSPTTTEACGVDVSPSTLRARYTKAPTGWARAFVRRGVETPLPLHLSVTHGRGRAQATRAEHFNAIA